MSTGKIGVTMHGVKGRTDYNKPSLPGSSSADRDSPQYTCCKRRPKTTVVPGKFECVQVKGGSVWCRKTELGDRADSETPRRLPLTVVWMFTSGRSATA